MRNAFVLTVALLFTAHATAAPKSPPGPELKSTAALVIDSSTGEVLYEQKPGLVTPIASIV